MYFLITCRLLFNLTPWDNFYSSIINLKKYLECFCIYDRSNDYGQYIFYINIRSCICVSLLFFFILSTHASHLYCRRHLFISLVCSQISYSKVIFKIYAKDVYNN
jgi:hypothetical protein